jgi:tryptophan halogenase
VGRDADAWLTALMLQLSLVSSTSGVSVELIELPSQLCPHDYYSVLPSHKALHKVLGVNENALLKTCSGLYVLAQRFSNWSGAENPFIHAYDTLGNSMDNVDFFQYWLKARKNGLNVPLEDFSLGAVAAKQGRFVVLGDSSGSFSRATHGFHLSALPYLQAVGKAALKAGLIHRTGTVKSVVVQTGIVQSLILQDDSVIDGDLFIDATGTEAVLISQLEENNYESWQHWLPCDRKLVASAPPLNPVPAFSQISAFTEGWVGFFSLANRTAVTAVYSSRHTTSNRVLQKMATLSGGNISGAVESQCSAGARKKHWIGNCIALGTAAVNLDAVDATDLHLLHLGLSLLRELFPVNKYDMKEAALFNEKMQSYATNVRDFQVAHYQLNKRIGESFWDDARQTPPPPALAEKIALFAQRGCIAMREDETFQEENWTSLFVGHGVMPKAYDPLVDKMPEQEQIEQFQQMLHHITNEVQNMPSLQAHVEMNSF